MQSDDDASLCPCSAILVVVSQRSCWLHVVLQKHEAIRTNKSLLNVPTLTLLRLGWKKLDLRVLVGVIITSKYFEAFQ
jgi:hypothetical protein